MQNDSKEEYVTLVKNEDIKPIKMLDFGQSDFADGIKNIRDDAGLTQL